jgi:integrase
VWQTHVGQTKTEDAEATVPVLPSLAYVLDTYKKARSPKPQDYMFAGPTRGTPLNLHNLSARIIKPALKEAKIAWKGWHAFRRGLATNLYELGITPKVIQGILRHSDIGTTLQFYTQVPESATKEALNQLDQWFSEMDNNANIEASDDSDATSADAQNSAGS